MRAVLMIMIYALPSIMAPPSWSQRMTAARAERGSVPARRNADADWAAAIAEELRAAVISEVEPAIAHLRNLEHGSDEDCFRSAAGRYFRYRCCVYFSTLAAGLLELRFGHQAEREHGDSDSNSSLYGLMARWLLEPPALAQAGASERAQMLMATAGADAAFGLRGLRQAAGMLPGPLGRYAAPISVRGVRGTLWRCEVSTVHTYLIFEAAGMDDVFVDVTWQQFLLLPDWMTDVHFEAAAAGRLLSEQPQHFVGSGAQLQAHLTISALHSALQYVYAHGGAPPEYVPFQHGRFRDGALEEMNLLRSEGIFALGDRRRRRQMCGHPSQHDGNDAPPPPQRHVVS